jgi:hypothetical protein
MTEILQPNFDFCLYHEGGPLIVRDVYGPDGDVVVGIVSWGIGCGIMPGVFARVSSGYEWIQATVCETSNDPPGSLCGEPTNASTTRMPTRSKWMVTFFTWLGKLLQELHSMITFPYIATKGLRGNLPRCLQCYAPQIVPPIV